SVHVHLTGLPTSTAALSAVLSNEYGMTWQTGSGGTAALNVQHTAGSSNADLFFLPLRNDESNDLMTLTLNFGGTQYFFQFQGGACSVNARGTPIGTTSLTVSTVSQLLAAVDTSHAADSTHQVAKIHLSAGTYNMTQPLVLNYPVQIDADPNVILSFTGIASASAAVQINSSHVTLQGFELLYPSSLNADVPLIRTGTDTIAVSITGMTLIDPNSLPPNTGYSHSIMVGGGSSGTISSNTLKGGTISLSSGPWEVSWNDYQGAAPNTTSPTLFETVNSHDLTLEYNHAHNVGTSGVTQRFLTMGSSFYGNSFGDTIQNNTIDGGFGQTVQDNAPEMMLTENYWPFFEGKPSSVSADGYVVQVPFLRSTGAPLQSGDILSILSRSSSGTGAQPGDWIQISQVIDPSSGSFNNYTTVLLDKPLPQGCIISINRGFVNSTYKANRIDLRDPSLNPKDTGMVFPGNNYGLTVAQNVFLGKNSFDITAAVTQDYESGSAWQVTPRWGQFHTPMLGVTITGNIVWDSTSSHIGVLHTPLTALDSGRVYFSGSLTDNQFNFSPAYLSAHPQAGPYLGITVGAPSYPAGYDYSGTQSPATLTAPPIDAGELRLTDSGNTTNLRTHGVYEDVRAATIASTVVRNQQRSLSYQGVYQDTGADYNGDGIADVGIYVPTDDKFALTFLNSQGQFVGGSSQSVFTYSSHTGGVYNIPITGDFNGDGITDVGVYIPSQDKFALTFLNAQGQFVGGSSVSVFNFGYHTGGVNSVPITGDFNGDGITDVGVYVPTDNKFALTFLNSQGQFVGGSSQSVFTYGYHNGSVNSVPITGDFNGDGVTDVGVYIPGDDKFELALLNGQGQYLGGASNQSIFTYSYHTGGAYSVPITGDFNGDGITDVGVYVPPDDKFALTFLNSQGQFVGGSSQSVFTYSYHTGGVYSVPITGDYNGDGITDVGVYVPPDDKFALTFLNSQGQFVGGSSQSVFNYGYHQPTVYSVPLVTTSGPVTSNGIVANSIIRTTPLVNSESTTSSTSSLRTTSAKTSTNASVTTRSTGTSTTTKTPVPQGILTSSPFRKGLLSF
ncbi:FG-GAP repeat domain-containing protein, partial [Singulisphaera rosea]